MGYRLSVQTYSIRHDKIFNLAAIFLPNATYFLESEEVLNKYHFFHI